MKPYGAIRQANGKYVIVGRTTPMGRKTSTYNIRGILASAGGVWNGELERWENVNEEALCKINASKRIKVLIAPFCHMREEYRLVFKDEIRDGEVPAACPICDTGYSSGFRAKILKIVGES